MRRIRSSPAIRQVSVLVLLPADEAPSLEDAARAGGGQRRAAPAAGERAARGWLAKLLLVARRVEARIPVQGQVVGTPRAAAARALLRPHPQPQLNGMLLASPVRLPDSPDLDLEFSCRDRAAACRRWAAWCAKRRRWPGRTWATGWSSCSCRRTAGRARACWCAQRQRAVPPGELTHGIHSTLRRDDWIYEILEPVRFEAAGRPRSAAASRDACGARDLAAAPFYVVDGHLARRRPARRRALLRAPPGRPGLALPAGRAPAASPCSSPVARCRRARCDECLRSLAAQTLADHEVIAVDDGSADGSGRCWTRGAPRDGRAARACARRRAGWWRRSTTALEQARAPLRGAHGRGRRSRTRAGWRCRRARLLAEDAGLGVLGCRVRLDGGAGAGNRGMAAYVDWLERPARARGHRPRPAGGVAAGPPQRDDARRAAAALGGYRDFDGPGGLRPLAARARGGRALRQAGTPALLRLARRPRAASPAAIRATRPPRFLALKLAALEEAHLRPRGRWWCGARARWARPGPARSWRAATPWPRSWRWTRARSASASTARRWSRCAEAGRLARGAAPRRGRPARRARAHPARRGRRRPDLGLAAGGRGLMAVRLRAGRAPATSGSSARWHGRRSSTTATTTACCRTGRDARHRG